jgi:hypothetical protein
MGVSLESPSGTGLPSYSTEGKEPQTSFIDEAEGFLLGLVPGAKLALDWKGERQKFAKLSEQEKLGAIAWEAFGAALWALPAAGPVAKNIWSAGARKLGGKLAAKRIAQYVKPIEDIATYSAESYENSLRKTLLGRQFALAPTEAEAVVLFQRGNKRALNHVLFQKEPPTESFKRLVQPVRGGEGAGAFARLELKPEIGEKLTRSNIRSRQFLVDYQNEFYSRMKVFGEARTEQFLGKGESGFQLYGREARASFSQIMGKIYGKEAALGKTLELATDEELVAAREFVRGSLFPATVRSVAGPGSWAMFRRVGSVLGRGEVPYGTRSNCAEPIEQAIRQASEYKMKKLQVLDGILLERGFLKASAKGKLSATEKLSSAVTNKALQAFQLMKGLENKLARENIADTRKTIEQEVGKLFGTQLKEDIYAKQLVDGLLDFSNHLSKDLTKDRIWRVLDRRELNMLGRVRAEKIMSKIEPRLDELFSTSAKLSTVEKHNRLSGILDEITGKAKAEGWSWFDYKTSKGAPLSQGAINKIQERFLRDLSLAEGGTFPRYSPNPIQAIPSRKGQIMAILHGEEFVKKKSVSEFYMRLEKLGARDSRSLEQEIVKRISAQAQALYLYPTMTKVAGNMRGLPPDWKKYVEHYMARMLHMPSRVDSWVATLLTRTYGAAQRAIGQTPLAKLAPKANWEGVYDAFDVVNLSKKINDLTYTAFLGFKPFSALRNYIQPLMMVPTDLGGIKDIGTLARGYNRAMFEPETRATLKKMGVIPEEFTGEFANQSYEIFRQRPKIGKFTLPSNEDIRSAAMWMFSQSHEHNCYVTGAAALTKWEDAVKKVGIDNLGALVKKAGIRGRRDDVKAEVIALLKAGRSNDARDVFVRSVVEDTQFIYGPTSSPLITQAGGGIGKTASIFQTFWMNYGDTLGKWATTGTVDEKAERLFTFMLSTGMAYGLMRTLWEHDVSASTVGLGPFESIDMLREGPPAWRLAGQGLKTLTTIAGIAETNQPYTEAVRRQLASLATAAGTGLTPGGLQFKQTIRRTSEEGLAGFLKSLVRFKRDE